MKTKAILFFLFVTSALAAQNWKFDFDAAKLNAENENKLIVLVFQGSDWCAPCIKLEQNIWSDTTFLEYADENLVMVKADFPRKKKNHLSDEQTEKNRALAEKYNKRGYFPFVVIFNSRGKQIGTTGYDKNKSPQDYIDLIKSFE